MYFNASVAQSLIVADEGICDDLHSEIKRKKSDTSTCSYIIHLAAKIRLDKRIYSLQKQEVKNGIGIWCNTALTLRRQEHKEDRRTDVVYLSGTDLRVQDTWCLHSLAQFRLFQTGR